MKKKTSIVLLGRVVRQISIRWTRPHKTYESDVHRVKWGDSVPHGDIPSDPVCNV
jgi:hypothetical protein